MSQLPDSLIPLSACLAVSAAALCTVSDTLVMFAVVGNVESLGSWRLQNALLLHQEQMPGEFAFDKQCIMSQHTSCRTHLLCRQRLSKALMILQAALVSCGRATLCMCPSPGTTE